MDNIIRAVSETEIFPRQPKKDDLLKFIECMRKTNSTNIHDIISGTEYTEHFAYRCRAELERLKLLKTFIPELPVIDIDYDKVRIWELYKYSDNWYIYYKSDDIRKRYAEKGVNFDEIDLVDDEVEDV